MLNLFGVAMINNKVLMITGGTGSFGNAVLKDFLTSDASEIRIFSRDEKKQDDMRNLYPDPRLSFIIGDTRDYESVAHATRGVDFIFHAAALKQVPSCEFYPMEALKTNVIGTDNVLSAAEKNGVERVVVLSTDKAVYPINSMGLTKAMAEKVMISQSRFRRQDSPVFCATRYGNVMASRGSVIPLFISQIKGGTPLTITDPNMTRFLMSLDQSVDLVKFAFSEGQPGDIFVQKAPASTVLDLAEALQEILDYDTPISIIGTRHGEKLYESLLSREEMMKAEDMDDYYRVPADIRSLNYGAYSDKGAPDLSNASDYTSHNTQRLNKQEVKSLLLTLDCVKEALRV